MKKQGLTKDEVVQARALYGRNILPEPPRRSFRQKLLEQLQEPLIKILLVALGINIFLASIGEGEWLESWGILVAVALATLVATWSEYRSENAFRRLQEEASRSTCRVWRDGSLQELGIEELVVGDLVILESGAKVPADGLLLEGSVQVDQSALNGESEAVEKKAVQLGSKKLSRDANDLDLSDEESLFRGTVVVAGKGLMQVTRVGAKSLYGQLTQELKDNERLSPMQLKLKELAKKISRFGYIMGIVIALAMLAQKIALKGSLTAFLREPSLVLHEVTQALIMGVIIIVMAVPEGLPLMLALVCSLNMRKMLADNVLVRRLIGIETAGSLNLLFTDKTGTITKGRLEVVSFIDGEGQEYGSLEHMPGNLQALLGEQILLNTSSTYSEGSAIGGNMTERALNNFYFPGNKAAALGAEQVAFLPFDSKNKYSGALVTSQGQKRILYKGAPEVLLAQVGSYYNEQGQVQPWGAGQAQAVAQQQRILAGRAMRLLAFCSYEPGRKGDAAIHEICQLEAKELLQDKLFSLEKKELTLLGMVAIRDEVRPEAVEAIRKVQQAGVQVVMVTGDNKETATAIAREASLLKSEQELVLHSRELGELSDGQVKELLPRLRVVARALPLDKLRLVRLAQELNLVVGMTGDGVNDAPALKRADVGFAMGSGTEVAKEAGDIIILDDNFLSIKQALLYGRTIYHNMAKFLTFQLTINCAAVGISVVAPLFNMEMPLTILQILWINLIMDTLAALAFGSEPALACYLREQPKRRDSGIITRNMLASILTASSFMILVGVLFFKSAVLASFFRGSEGQLSLYTGYFCSFVLMAVANGLSLRSKDGNSLLQLQENPGFFIIMAGIVIVQIVLTYVGGDLLRTVPLGATEWLLAAGPALVMLAVARITKSLK